VEGQALSQTLPDSLVLSTVEPRERSCALCIGCLVLVPFRHQLINLVLFVLQSILVFLKLILKVLDKLFIHLLTVFILDVNHTVESISNIVKQLIGLVTALCQKFFVVDNLSILFFHVQSQAPTLGWFGSVSSHLG